MKLTNSSEVGQNPKHHSWTWAEPPVTASRNRASEAFWMLRSLHGLSWSIIWTWKGLAYAIIIQDHPRVLEDIKIVPQKEILCLPVLLDDPTAQVTLPVNHGVNPSKFIQHFLLGGHWLLSSSQWTSNRTEPEPVAGGSCKGPWENIRM